VRDARLTDIPELQQTAEDLTAEISSINAQLDEAQAEQLENTRAIMRAQKNAER
jgi:structural maintenance of chromosome 3 (chondroitin sulfate proteoglycan 6)